MSPCDRVLDAVTEGLQRARGAPAVGIALSGGLDSTVLLEAACRLAPALGTPLPRALHVDHGLEPGAASWRRHCRELCRARGVALVELAVDARPAAGESPEAAAREARYAALAVALAPGEVLCTAHHADDQAETVLLNLLRGCGVDGSAGMSRERALAPGRLLRPLLAVRRAQLEQCARAWGLGWIDDPSNRRLRHPRNALRHRILPALEALAPGAVASLARSAALHREAAWLVGQLAESDLCACLETDGSTLSRHALGALAGPRRRQVLRRWLAAGGLRSPGRARLRELERQILEARPDRCPRIALAGGEVRLHRDRALLFAGAVPPAPSAPQPWRPGETLELPAGRLWAEPAQGAGLRDAGPLEVRFRAGGERCRPSGRTHSQTLKRLLQERGVPPWARAALPLLYRDGAIAGVADLFVCHGHEAQPGEPGWRVRWEARHA